MKLKKILCTLLSFCIIGVPIAHMAVLGAGATDAEELQKQLEQLNEDNKKYQSILDQANSDIENKEEYSKALTEKIKNLDEKITLTSQSIEKLNESIESKQNSIEEANSDIDDQIDALCARLRTIYMSGSASQLEIILGAKSFSDFIDKVTLVKTLTNYDKQIISEINEKLDSVEQEKAELESDKTEVESQQKSLETDKEDLNKTLEENKELLSTLYETRDNAKSEIESAVGEEDAIHAKITAYYAKKAQQAGTNNGADVSATGFVWPVPGFYTLSSLWNEDRTTYNHGAVDIADSGIMGATVVAAYEGTVIDVYNSCYHNWAKESSCGCNGGYGNYVMIDHGDGKVTIYGHLTSAVAETGQTVTKGQTIGYVGSTGNSTGAHLHFECRYNGVKYNPMIEYE